MGRGDARMGAQVDRPGRLALSSAGPGRAVVPVHGHEASKLTATLFSEANPIPQWPARISCGLKSRI